MMMMIAADGERFEQFTEITREEMFRTGFDRRFQAHKFIRKHIDS